MATRRWREIREEKSKMSRAERAAIDAEVREDVARMRLGDLRRARHMTQRALADTLEMAQGDVSKLERRTDTYVRTLRSYIEALGGSLRIIAEFPGGQPIEIAGFGLLDEAAKEVGASNKDRRHRT
jgi:transcriptional regulator with XRE-family HTH domain